MAKTKTVVEEKLEQEKKPRTIPRLIQFFKVSSPDFSREKMHRLLLSVDLKNEDAFMKMDNEASVCVLSSEKKDGNYRVVFGRARTDVWPELLDENGKLQPVTSNEKAKLVEKIHMVFFDNYIVGSEYNQPSARASTFAYYIHDLFSDFPEFTLDPIIEPDIKTRLDNMKGVKLMKFRYRKDKSDILQDIKGDAINAVRRLATVFGAEELTLELKGLTSETFTHKAWEFMRGLYVEKPEACKYVWAKAGDRRTSTLEEFNLGKALIRSTTRVAALNEKTRAIDGDSMFAHIEEAYKNYEESLKMGMVATD